MCWCPLYIYLQVQAPAHVQLRAQQWSTLSPTTQHFTTAWTPQFFPHITPFCVYIISLLSPLKQHLPEFYCSLFEHNFRARDQAAGAWGGAETISPALFWPVLWRLHFPVWLRIREQCLPRVNPEQALLYLFGWCLPGHIHLFICCCPFAVEQHSIFISVPWLQDHTRGSLWPSLGVLAAPANWPGHFSLAPLQSEGTDTVVSVADVQHHPWQGKTPREISVFMQELWEASPVSGVSWSDQYELVGMASFEFRTHADLNIQDWGHRKHSVRLVWTTAWLQFLFQLLQQPMECLFEVSPLWSFHVIKHHMSLFVRTRGCRGENLA